MTLSHPTTGDGIEEIHLATATYTTRPEIDALIDATGWPERQGLLLDPGCGNGGIILAAIERLDIPCNNIHALVGRVCGVEIHPATAREAQEAVALALFSKGWRSDRAAKAASHIIINADYLQHGGPPATTIVANPPYMRRAGLPAAYQTTFNAVAAEHARGDLMHAFIDRMVSDLPDNGIIAMITSDRWALNEGTAQLRAIIGAKFGLHTVKRLNPASAFHRQKDRRRGSVPRVHPISVVLAKGGRPIDKAPIILGESIQFEGQTLETLVSIRLAPWMGPDGIFTVEKKNAPKGADLVPCIDAKGKKDRWAIVTTNERPSPAVMAHLEREMSRMPKRGRRRTPWLPPESFAGHLPLTHDAVIVPRISKTLEGRFLPAGILPTNHNLVIVAGISPERIITILTDERVRAQADAQALSVDGGYRSYPASLLRRLVIPDDLIGIETW